MVQQTSSTITLSSLYSSGQCLLSVLGSIGVILLFAGIPQLIYAPQLNPGSLMTFLLGALLISLMVAGNAFIGYKYRQLVRSRREDTRTLNSGSVSAEDKPPSYDDLLQEEGLPPAYSAAIKEKPPRYEELVTEVFNWQAITKVPESYRSSATATASTSTPSGVAEEIPIIVPIQRHLSENLDETQTSQSPACEPCMDNLGFRDSTETLRTSDSTETLRTSDSTETLRTSDSTPSSAQNSTNDVSGSLVIYPQFIENQRHCTVSVETFPRNQAISSSPDVTSVIPAVHRTVSEGSMTKSTQETKLDVSSGEAEAGTSSHTSLGDLNISASSNL